MLKTTQKDTKETHNKIKRVFIQNLIQNIPKRNSKENSSKLASRVTRRRTKEPLIESSSIYR